MHNDEVIIVTIIVIAYELLYMSIMHFNATEKKLLD